MARRTRAIRSAIDEIIQGWPDESADRAIREDLPNATKAEKLAVWRGVLKWLERQRKMFDPDDDDEADEYDAWDANVKEVKRKIRQLGG